MLTVAHSTFRDRLVRVHLDNLDRRFDRRRRARARMLSKKILRKIRRG